MTPFHWLRCRSWPLLLLLALGNDSAIAQGLPTSLQKALDSAGMPAQALALWIAPAGSGSAPWLAHQADRPMNPASLTKLVTSAAALSRLGPGYRWRTSVLVDGPVRNGHLDGHVYLVGGGDPQLTIERLWLLLQELRQRGVRVIDGDMVLDRQAFQIPPVEPGAFDGEPSRPYNVQPDAFVISHRAVTLRFTPRPEERTAQVTAWPAPDGWTVPASIPLSADTDCGDWRTKLRADLSAPTGPRFDGALPAICGERTWPMAPPPPEAFEARLLSGLWHELGGRIAGQIRDGRTPATATPLFDFTSPTLGEVLRDMNKFSNNLVADQLMLTLSMASSAPATWEHARALIGEDLRDQAHCAPQETVVDRGSGLSRRGRLSARCLGSVLQWAWRSPWMPELAASLPIAGEDTAKRALSARGRAHLKTGSLDGVAGLAGFVDGPGGQR